MGESIKNDLKEKISNSFLEYDEEITINLIKNALKNGVEPLVIVDALSKGLRKIGDMFGNGEVFLPELMMAASIMKTCMDILTPLLSESKTSTMLGRIVIGTVKGDIHDIGKNIVRSLLQANGFEVIDLGVDVDSEKFIEAIKNYKPNILAMSALLTTTINEMHKVIKKIEENGLRKNIKIIIGGAPTSEEYAKKIGADAWGSDANDAVTKVKMLLGIKEEK
ncbi:MAG: corrinoid protein [Candidatus Methanomethylicia archaeon]